MGVTVDIDGEPRPADGNLDGVKVADLGADEFTARCMYLPAAFKSHTP